jgi:hypothetical protein
MGCGCKSDQAVHYSLPVDIDEFCSGREFGEEKRKHLQRLEPDFKTLHLGFMPAVHKLLYHFGRWPFAGIVEEKNVFNPAFEAMDEVVSSGYR